MTQGHLLNPRYKVLVKYPEAIYKPGAIIACEYPVSLNEKYYDQFPECFRKLYWYEDRTIEEMPPFVEIKGEIFSVDRWEIYIGTMTPYHKDKEYRTSFRIKWYFYKNESNPVFNYDLDTSKK